MRSGDARQTFCRTSAGALDWTCWQTPAQPIESPAHDCPSDILAVSLYLPSSAAGH